MRRSAYFVCTDARVRHLDSSVRILRVLGLRIHARTRMRDGTRIVWLRDPVTGQLLELFELSPRSPISEPLPRSPRNDRAVVFGVREVEPIVRRLETAGARVVARFDQGSARFVFLRDPNGIRIELVAWRSGSRRPEDPPLLSLVRRRRPRRRG